MKQEQIIEAARKLFYKYGFKRVSVDEIAREAKVTKRTLYMYFKSKEEILKYFINEEIQKMECMVRDIEAQKLGFLDTIHQVLYKLLKYKNEHEFLNRIIEEIDVFNNPMLIENLKVIDSKIQSYILQKLNIAIEKGYTKVEDPEVTAFLIYKMYIALMFDWNENNSKLDENAVANQILNILKFGLIREDGKSEKQNI